MMHGAAHPVPHREEYVAINQLNPHTHDKVNIKMIVIECCEFCWVILKYLL